uniref:Uncharacterized protein n=1 Tax=Timema bartmani TaxID=61472 RepID=A0A7R9I4S8_9NEOP|nr:unnamed protein product [Timema bartmani]
MNVNKGLELLPPLVAHGCSSRDRPPLCRRYESIKAVVDGYSGNSKLETPSRCIPHVFLRETDAELGRSSRLLSGMIMRSIQHRFVLFGVAVVFIIVIVLGIYFTVTK